jgi:hypothetical protein
LTVAGGLQQGKRMQMTEAFASAVTVTVPIFVSSTAWPEPATS